MASKKRSPTIPESDGKILAYAGVPPTQESSSISIRVEVPAVIPSLPSKAQGERPDCVVPSPDLGIG